MSPFTDLAGFAAAPSLGVAVRYAAATADPVAGTRTVRYIFSDESVARDGHTIATAGWQLDNFLSNPVFLWAHDTSQPPVGRITDIAKSGSRLVGTVEYADAETYPFADTIYRLVKGRYLNAVSVSWLPEDWSHSTDRSRPGGIDFKRQELLEVSQVPVPCLPGALATARSQGIDTGPLAEWAERILDGGEKIVIPRAHLERLQREARMPRTFARINPPSTGTVPMRRDLYTVGALADLVQYLAYLQSSSFREEEREGDGSPVPAMLADSLQQLGNILVVMTEEEVAELLAAVKADGAEDPDEAMAWSQAAALVARRAFGGAAARAGKVLSAENEACLRSALEHHEACGDLIRGMLAKATPYQSASDDGTDETEAAARAARIAEARALKEGATT